MAYLNRVEAVAWRRGFISGVLLALVIALLLFKGCGPAVDAVAG